MTRQATRGPVASHESPPDMEPPLPTEPPPDFDPSPVHPVGSAAAPGPPTRPKPVADGPVADPPAADLLSQAMGDEAVQTLLEVFPGDIKDVEEI